MRLRVFARGHLRGEVTLQVESSIHHDSPLCLRFCVCPSAENAQAKGTTSTKTVCSWRLADMKTASKNVRFRAQSRH